MFPHPHGTDIGLMVSFAATTQPHARSKPMRQAVVLLAICIAAFANTSAPAPTKSIAGDRMAAAVKTGKERLGDKASDEQRANDCHVPPQKRGNSKRPAQCAAE